MITDPAGNESDPVVTPALPVIESPRAGAPGNDATPTFTGTAGGGDTVELRLPDGTVVCSTTADASGAWECTPSAELPEGETLITPVAIDANGVELAGVPHAVVIDTTPPAPLDPADVVCAENADGTVTCSGSGATPGDTVIITDGNDDLVCQVTVPASGEWQCTSSGPVTGPVTIVVEDPAGNVSTPISIEIDPFEGGADAESAAGANGSASAGGSASASGAKLVNTGGSDLNVMAYTALALVIAGGIAFVKVARHRNRV